MSRIATSGTRTSSRRRGPSGLKKVWTVTSFGISCAAAAAAKEKRQMATKRRRMNMVDGRSLTADRCRWRSTMGARNPRASSRKPSAICGRPGSILPPFTREGRMKSQRHLWIGGAFATLISALFIGQLAVERSVAAQAKSGVQAPRFEVDPMWPKPLPNHWLLGSAIGVSVDAQDHIWIIRRSSATLNNNERGAELDPPTGECCKGAPPVLEFDQAGNLLRHWGGPGQGYEWPQSNHGITIDYKGNVWIGGNGAHDAHVVKFTQEGKFLAQYGHFGKSGGSNDQENFGRVAKIFVDPRANEAYIAD